LGRTCPPHTPDRAKLGARGVSIRSGALSGSSIAVSGPPIVNNPVNLGAGHRALQRIWVSLVDQRAPGGECRCGIHATWREPGLLVTSAPISTCLNACVPDRRFCRTCLRLKTHTFSGSPRTNIATRTAASATARLRPVLLSLGAVVICGLVIGDPLMSRAMTGRVAMGHRQARLNSRHRGLPRAMFLCYAPLVLHETTESRSPGGLRLIYE
jgi:hypothetical protein